MKSDQQGFSETLVVGNFEFGKDDSRSLSSEPSS